MDHLIKDLTLLLVVSLPINILFHKVKLPSLMGFLIAGVIIGPNSLGWIGDPESVRRLAEIGVILLLFVVGLEFSLARMVKSLALVAGMGSLQVGGSILLGFLVLLGAGLPVHQSLLIGLLVALSSTTIVLKMITDRAELDTSHGKSCIGTLLFQDLCVVPMMLVVPLLADTASLSALDFLVALGKSLAAVALIFSASRLLVPRALRMIAKNGSKEHMTLFVILIILGTGWVSEVAGLSLAMGAFIAGLIISESEFNHQIILDILPLKDYFGSIFFISVGMLLQVDEFFQWAPLYLGWTAALIALKALVAFIASWLMKNPPRISFIVGLRLAQVGEFSLLLASLAVEQSLLSEGQYQSFLIVSILSMLAAPLLIQGSSGFSLWLHALFGKSAGEEKPEPAREDRKPLSGHVIIAGYGLVGRNLSRVLMETQTPFVVVDMDGERIKQALSQSMEALYGDSTHRDTLSRAGVKQARMIVFSISDYFAMVQGVRLARRLNPEIYILVRTRLASQVDELRAAGADQVIPEEFETSVEIFSRVLREFRIPNNIIEQQVELIRLEGYSMFRGLSLNVESLKKFSTYLTVSLTESFVVLEDSWVADKTMGDLNLAEVTGAQLIAVMRGKEMHPHPSRDFRFRVGDLLVLFGAHASLPPCLRLLQTGSP